MRCAESKASMIEIRLFGRFDKPAADANWSTTTPTSGEINVSLFILTHDAPELSFSPAFCSSPKYSCSICRS